MKQIFLICTLIVLCTPAFAENNTIEKRVNSSSTHDRYNLPEYDISSRSKLVRKFNNKSEKVKNNTPALLIINEPYPLLPSSNLTHMGQTKMQPQSLLVTEDLPAEISSAPMPSEKNVAMPSTEPMQSYQPETLVIEQPPAAALPVPMPLTPEPLPVQEVASLDAAEPMLLEPIAHQESLPQRARFYALAGTSLRETLRAWAGTQEFSLVWDSNRDYRVKQTVSSNSDAEMALRDILSMYEGDAVRPVGKLYRDPRTSRPVLVVKSDK